MYNHDERAADWRRSSDCETNTCLEVHRTGELLWLRNSTRPTVAVSFTEPEWRSFRAAVLRGEFDNLETDPVA